MRIIMSKSTVSAPVVASTVRAWANANGVQVGERGRIAPAVVAQFTKATGQKHVEGTPKTVEVEVSYTQPSGRKARKVVFVPDTEARTLAGSLAGKRGPLSKAALAAVAEAKGADLTASSKPGKVAAKAVDATPKA